MLVIYLMHWQGRWTHLFCEHPRKISLYSRHKVWKTNFGKTTKFSHIQMWLDILENLWSLKCNISRYFLKNNSKIKLIINPFEDYIKNFLEFTVIKESFLDLTNNFTLSSTFKIKKTSNFWLQVKKDYFGLPTEVLQFLITFLLT